MPLSPSRTGIRPPGSTSVFDVGTADLDFRSFGDILGMGMGAALQQAQARLRGGPRVRDPERRKEPREKGAT